MQKAATLRGGLLLAAALVAGLVAALYATRSNGAGMGGTARVVMTAKNKALGKTVLVNRRHMTLYSLSVERHGRFICKNAACLSLWTPLVVHRGTKPTGVRGLGTVRRPDGRTQVTYRGRPLYTFKQDRKPGDVKGNGFKDVGTWRVVTVGKSATPAPPPPPPTYTYPSGY
jgi:predicted lipoprotein with Yx(FWY)xxD motif